MHLHNCMKQGGGGTIAGQRNGAAGYLAPPYSILYLNVSKSSQTSAAGKCLNLDQMPKARQKVVRTKKRKTRQHSLDLQPRRPDLTKEGRAKDSDPEQFPFLGTRCRSNPRSLKSIWKLVRWNSTKKNNQKDLTNPNKLTSVRKDSSEEFY